jgi:hypothetical protein
LLLDAGQSIGADWVLFEALVIHGAGFGETSTIGLWFEGVGRTGEYFVDPESEATVIRSVIPQGWPFEIVGFPPIIEENAGAPATEADRTWDRVFASFSPQPSKPGEGTGTVAAGGIFAVIDLTTVEPSVTFMSESAYFDVIAEMADSLE